MPTLFNKRRIVTCAVFLSLAFSFRDAYGRTCASASDCPRGFGCRASADGGASTCEWLPCQDDSDCGPGFACLQDSVCLPGPDGGSAPVGACVPQWLAPCNSNTDCGDGFQCVFGGGACDCSGNRDDIPADASTVIESCADVSPQFACAGQPGCPPIQSICDGGSCVCWGVQQMCKNEAPQHSCASAADCPSGWSCACSDAADDAGTDADSTGCGPMLCEPPNQDLAFQTPIAYGGTLYCGGDGPVPSGSSGASASSGGATGTPAGPGTSASAALDAGDTPRSAAATSSGTNTGSASNSAGGSGCDISAFGTSSGGWLVPWAGLAAIAGAARRIRRGPRSKRTLR
jgi:hypothetical protein